MKRPIFTGLCTALVTPFHEGRVNYPMLDVLIRRQIDAGVDAIVLAGTTGESATLTTDEKLAIFHRGVEVADGRCKIIAGTGSNSTVNAIALSKAAKDTGVDGLLIVTPYYNKTTQSGLVKHYSAIADAVQMPIIAYNVPSRTGMDIGVDACRELSKMEYIAGIKEASGDISKSAKIIASCGDDLPLYSGNDDQTVPILSLGGMGVISVASNVVPARMNAMVTAAMAGEYRIAAMLQRQLLPLMELLFCQVNPIPVKAAMKLTGFDAGPCRMPLDDLTPDNEARLRTCLNELLRK